ncbi:MAG: YgjV family protein [Gammaproteobacteria bacterium]|nr:YgjV family protein [Gammaproteobacteria bacterium]MBU2249293.1 YgjV family protein [Gammaproteobacteria bacterium]MBU2428807.1 YgjV family protein [Gammaproteobacteria bacterium]
MPELSSQFLGSQLLALLAFIAGISAFQLKRRQPMLVCWCISAALNASHFVVLGQLAAGLFVGFTAIRFLVAAYYPRPQLMWLFLFLSTVLLGLSYQTPLQCLPFLAAVVGTIGSFQQKVLLVRSCMAVGACAWICHNVIVGSPMAVMMELAFLASNAIGFLRQRKKMVAA